MGTVYLLRHGESILTEHRLVCGVTNPPLSEKGKETARRAGRRLREKDIQFDRVFCSPLQRCQMTVREIGITEFSVDPRLREMNFGVYEGNYIDKGEWHEIMERFAELTADGGYTIPGGDKVREFFDRAGETVLSYLDDGFCGSTLLACHAIFLSSAYHSLTDGKIGDIFTLHAHPCDCLMIWREGGELHTEFV